MNILIKKYTLNSFLLVGFGLFFQSCQDEIEIELKNSDNTLVIEGNISDSGSPDTIKLSTNVNFSDLNEFPTVTRAQVILKDNKGNSETLSEVKPGSYINQTLFAKPGSTYTLFVSHNGKEYNCTSTIPQPVNLDTILVQINPFGGGYKPCIKFKDPAGSKNFYRILAYKNGRFFDSNIIDDRILDGMVIEHLIFGNENDLIKTGDKMDFILQSIDEPMYNYFRTLDQVANGGMQNTSPANPISNISNGALGYFNAFSSSSKKIVVQ